MRPISADSCHGRGSQLRLPLSRFLSLQVEQKVIDRLAKGITVGGVDYGPIKVTPIEKRNVEEHSTNEWVYVSLKEGRTADSPSV